MGSSARAPKLTTTDPLTLDFEGSPVQILFSPDNNPELRIVNEILKAQASAYFMMFTFAKTVTEANTAITSRMVTGTAATIKPNSRKRKRSRSRV